jgi:hypothetical protein
MGGGGTDFVLYNNMERVTRIKKMRLKGVEWIDLDEDRLL